MCYDVISEADVTYLLYVLFPTARSGHGRTQLLDDPSSYMYVTPLVVTRVLVCIRLYI